MKREAAATTLTVIKYLKYVIWNLCNKNKTSNLYFQSKMNYILVFCILKMHKLISFQVQAEVVVQEL